MTAPKVEAALRAPAEAPSLLQELQEAISLEGFGCACTPDANCTTCRARVVLSRVVQPILDKHAALTQPPTPQAPAVAVPVAWMTPGYPQLITDEYKRENLDEYPWIKDYTVPLYTTTQQPAQPQAQGDALREALTRLWPLLERGMHGYVFTADKAGEVAADMQTLRAAALSAPPPAAEAGAPSVRSRDEG
jgi:hypothetical protein